MKKISNQIYWEKRASKYRSKYLTTTNHFLIKKLEITILEKMINSNFKQNKKIKILELGCGNGINLFSLCKIFTKNEFVGIDYVKAMIDEAKKIKSKNITIIEGDISNETTYKNLKKFDLIYTNRCLINIKSKKKIKKIINIIKNHLNYRGKVFFLENFTDGYKRHNLFRNILGLKNRNIAHFNRFLDERYFINILKRYFIVEQNINYSSLYDLLLYVLSPSTNGKIKYNSRIQQRLGHLIIDYLRKYNQFLTLNIRSGQNQLIVCKKK